MKIEAKDFSSEQEDIALATLRALAIEDSSVLPLTLIETLYLLQKRHQFDVDRGASLQQMQRVLEDYVNSLDNGNTK